MRALRRAASIGCIVLLAGWSFGGCAKNDPISDEKEPAIAAAPDDVLVAEVQSQTWPVVVRVQGSLLGYDRAVVGSKLAARVDEVPIDLGTVVRRGDPLVVLDRRDRELQVEQAAAQLAQARASLGLRPDDSADELDRLQAPPVRLERALMEEARSNLERSKQLLESRVIAAEEAERLQAQFKAAEARYHSSLNDVDSQIATIRVRRAELALAEQLLADTRVVAPFDGIVEQRHVSPGEYLQEGQAVATLVRTDSLRFTAGVPERIAAQIRPGLDVLVRIDGEAAPIRVQVSRLSPALELASRSLLMEADVPNSDLRLRTGLFAEADIIVDAEAQTLAVPASAVFEFAGIEKVWIVRDGKSQEQPIRTGRRNADRIEILDGLTTGDLIIPDARQGHAGAVNARHGEITTAPQTASIAFPRPKRP